MQPSTYNKRVKEYRGTVALRLVEEWIRTNKPIRPCYTTGSGRHTANSDHGDKVRHILGVCLGLPCTSGNDAPRGGATGRWIKVDAPGWGKMKPVRDQWAKEQEDNQRRDELKEQARLRAEADKYAGLVGDYRAVLLAWWDSQEFHPAPAEVLEAKQRSGLTWKQVGNFCRTHSNH